MDGTNSELQQAQQLLDEFEKNNHVKTPSLSVELDYVFDLSYTDLQALTPQRCAEYAFLLAQYSYYLQKIYNRENANYKWLDNKIKDLTCSKLNNYDQYTKYEVKLRLIATENEAIKKLISLLNFTEQKRDRLEFLSGSVKMLSDSLEYIRKSKVPQWKTNN